MRTGGSQAAESSVVPPATADVDAAEAPPPVTGTPPARGAAYSEDAPATDAGATREVRSPQGGVCARLTRRPAFRASQGSDWPGSDWPVDDDDMELGFMSVERLRLAFPPVQVKVGDESYSSWVSYQLAHLPLPINKPAFVAIAAVVYDMACSTPLPYAVGAQPAARGPGAGEWRLGVLPNRDATASTVAMMLMPGDPGVGKTSALMCVLLPSAGERSQLGGVSDALVPRAGRFSWRCWAQRA